MNITPNIPQRMSHNIPLAGNLEDNATVTARKSGAAQSFPFIHIIKNFCVDFWEVVGIIVFDDVIDNDNQLVS